jgi:hypothetical protein
MASQQLPVKPQDKSILQLAKEFLIIPFDKVILQSVPEIAHLSPVFLTLGTAFMAIITLNYPLAMFSASTFESLLFYNAFKLFADYSLTPALGIATPSAKGVCSSTFQSLTPSRFHWLLEQGSRNIFPNQPLYLISFAAAYCIQSLLNFSEEASELGPKVSNRTYLALAGAALFVGLYALYLSAFGCESFFSLALTIVIGALVGILICFQNTMLFGKSSVNLMFIPPLAKRSGMDYICVSSPK